MEEKNGMVEKIKAFVSRNKKKVIITVGAVGATVLGVGILGKCFGNDDDEIVEELEMEEIEIDQDDSTEE